MQYVYYITVHSFVGQFYGFCGSRTTKFPSNLVKDPCHNGSHLASTYSALATLKIVGYDVLNLDSKVLLLSMKKLQQPDGSFMPTHIGAETDLRFVYCAAAICSMLKDWSGMDKEKAKEYILNCQSYDGGFGMVPGSESHGRQLSQVFVLQLRYWLWILIV
uniref:Prenyltransferase alpha-alpha toroid domain-containing protein n=1 Tax=Aegilops tauschii subsp. strangulata TaxID=200361 RepID=A0A453DZ87_AEGTS